MVNDFGDKIKNFCKYHNKIYLYGTGTLAKTFLCYLNDEGMEMEGFITTNGGEKVLNKNVYSTQEAKGLLDREDGIILSVNEDIQNEIRNTVDLGCDMFSFSDQDYVSIESAILSKDKYYSTKRWEFQKEIKDFNWENILIIQLEPTYGDMIWSTAFCRELRNNYPQSHITLVMNQKFISLYKNCPYVNEILLYDCSTFRDCVSPEMIKKVQDYAKENLTGTYDVVFQPRLLSNMISFGWENILLAQESGARYRIAHALCTSKNDDLKFNLMEDMFTLLVKHYEAQHEVQNDLSMIHACSGKVANEKMELWLSEADKEYADTILMQKRKNKIVIIVALVGSEAKRSWDANKYGKVLKRLLDKYPEQLLFVFCGGADAHYAMEIVQEYIPENYVNLIESTDLSEAAAIISQSDLYIGSDTGLMHMASAFDVPVIEISASIMDAPRYWASSPVRTGPWMVPSIVLRPLKGLDYCKYMCQKLHAHCINQITEEQVENAIEQMIEWVGSKK